MWHSFWCVVFAEQECHLTIANVDERHLDRVEGSAVDSCEDQKQDGLTLLNGNVENEVIVLNAVDITSCNLKCAEGWYHQTYGNEAPFTCSPATDDRTQRAGIPTNPITCAGAFYLSRRCLPCRIYLDLKVVYTMHDWYALIFVRIWLVFDLCI